LIGASVEVINKNLYRPWESDSVFQSLLKQVTGFSVGNNFKLHVLYQLIQSTSNVVGDIAEVGVYRGGSAKFLVEIGKGKQVYLFDTFAGMPEVSDKDMHKEGDFASTSLEAVERFLGDHDNLSLFKGIFPETAEAIDDKRFSLVHIDVDIYQSVKDCSEFFYYKMNPGGVMLFDDYGALICPGAREAVDEFFAKRSDFRLYLPTGQFMVVKE